jgi:CO/xanthine dehydrogenase Mo-binding subunit
MLPSGGLVIHTATQWPFHVKRSVEKVLKYRAGPVIIQKVSMGIHLDGKIWYPSLTACHAALGAYITKKPVKLVLARMEDFRYSPKRNGAGIHIRSALGEKGEILATEVELSAGLGAYDVFADEIIDASVLGCLGIYRHGALKIDGFAQKANLPPQGPFAGFGLAQGIFAAERHVSRIADSLHQDPAEWRKNNFLPRNSKLALGAAIKEDIPVEQLLDTAASMSDYYRKWASYELLRIHRAGKEWDIKRDPLRGIGIALGYQVNGFLRFGSGRGSYAVETTLDKDGSLEIRTSMVSSGSEYEKIWRDIASEILSVDPSLVRVKADTTEGVPDSGPGTLSRNIFTITRLVERCCLSIRKQRFRDPLPITVRRASRPEKITGWGGSVIDASAISRPGWGAAVVEIQIDPVSWKPEIRGAWLAVDGGRILSETGARRTLKTGIIQALGWTCREELYYERGRIPENLIHHYDILRPQDIPPVSIDFIWNDTANCKGIGDLPFNSIPAAYVQAVSQAMDHPFEKIPLSPRDVWEAGRGLPSPEKAQKTEAKL